jgi:hypothetical protein
MRTIFTRTVFAGLALLALTTAARAQDRSRLLTSIEVKEFVTSSRPADHARLRDHFAALADKYTSDARRYRNVAFVMTGNPNHPPAVPPGARWSRAAEQAAASASIARELSAHHSRLADGRSSQAPSGAGPFEAGAGAPAPTAAHLNELAASARTPAQHRSLAEYYTTLTEQKTTAAKRYAAQAATYRAQVRKGYGDPAIHFDRLAKQSRESADAARAEAAKHTQLAQVG